MTRRALVVLISFAAAGVVGGVVGLTVFSSHADSPATDRGPPSQARVLDDRDQYALVEQIIDAKGHRRRGLVAALDEVRAAWLGRHYAWEVALVPALCRDPQTCVAMPFDHNREADQRIVQGWLPRLRMEPQVHADLLRVCEGHAPCVFTFEGRLDRLVLSAEDPTSVSFSDVSIVSTRAATSTESWVRRSRPRKTARSNRASADPNVVDRRTPVRGAR